MNYSIINYMSFCPVARQPALPYNYFCRTHWAVVLVLAPVYKHTATTHNVVMAHFTNIHYMPQWPIGYILPSYLWPRPHYKVTCIDLSLKTRVFYIFDHNCRFRFPLQLGWYGKVLCPNRWVVVLLSFPTTPAENEVDRPRGTTLKYVLAVYTMCPCYQWYIY